MSDPAHAPTPDQIPSWFGQILWGVCLVAAGAWLTVEHQRLSELDARFQARQQADVVRQQTEERRVDTRMAAIELEAGKRGTQLDEIRDRLAELKTSIARVDAHLGELGELQRGGRR